MGVPEQSTSERLIRRGACSSCLSVWHQPLVVPVQEVKSLKVQRFYRPEDISADLGYRAGFWDIYASSEQEEVDVEEVQSLCQVRRSGSPAGGPQHNSSCSCPGLQHLLAPWRVMEMCMPCVSRIFVGG